MRGVCLLERCLFVVRCARREGEMELSSTSLLQEVEAATMDPARAGDIDLMEVCQEDMQAVVSRHFVAFFPLFSGWGLGLRGSVWGWIDGCGGLFG